MTYGRIGSLGRGFGKMGAGADTEEGLTRDFVTDFGGVGNGSTDNSTALNNFGIWARAQSLSVTLTVPAGTYNFVLSDAFESLFDIPRLQIVGAAGTIFQNTTNGSSPWMPASFSNLHEDAGGVVALVASVAAGASSVTTLTAANAANYAVGQPVVIMSEDIQISSSNFSYPPNANLFDYVTVTGNNSVTGVVSFEPPLANSHLATNIDGVGTKLCGKARIWKLNGTFGGIPYEWGASHTYRGLDIRVPPAGGTPYISMVGHYQKWQGCIVGGISPQTADRIEFIGGHITALSEPDKLVKTLVIDGAQIDNILVFQSSSIDDVLINDCTVDVFLGSGLAKRVVITDCDIAAYTEGIAGTSYGHNHSTVITGGTISSWPVWGEYATATPLIIDGASITYASGIITLPKTLPDLANYNVIPNVTKINITSSSGWQTGDIGTGTVTSLTEDSTNIYIHIDTWPASLPAYSSGGRVLISRHGSFSMAGVTGCPEVVRACAAYARGKNHWQLLIDTLSAGGSGNWNDTAGWGHSGNLISATFNVTSAAGGGSLLTLNCASMLVAATMVGAVAFQIKIDCTVTGQRTFTQGALTGKTGADTVLLNSVSQSTLPAAKWMQTPFTYAFSSGTPTIEIELEFDSGSKFRTVV